MMNGQLSFFDADPLHDMDSRLVGNGLRQIVRVNGKTETVPREAVEHRRIGALLEDKSARFLSVDEQLKLLEQKDVLADKLATLGWSDMAIAANGLNQTYKDFSELVNVGIYRADAGVDTRRTSVARQSFNTKVEEIKKDMDARHSAAMSKEKIDGVIPFEIDLGSFFGKIPYIPSASPVLQEGSELLSCEIFPRKTNIAKNDRSNGELPDIVFAWRVSAVQNSTGGIHSMVEAMVEDHGRSSIGQVVGYFKELKGHSLDALPRLAPSINNAAIKAYEQALNSKKQDNLFAIGESNVQQESLDALSSNKAKRPSIER